MGNILVIEDDQEILNMLRIMVERQGYSVTTAKNGVEGIKFFRASPADIVITDIVMPEKEGLETILELREIYPEVKIIAVSGGGRYNSNDYLQSAKDFGADYVFHKPFKQKEILDAIEDLFGK